MLVVFCRGEKQKVAGEVGVKFCGCFSDCEGKLLESVRVLELQND